MMARVSPRQEATNAGTREVKKYLGILTCPTLDSISPTKGVSLELAIIEPQSKYLPHKKSPSKNLLKLV